MLFSCLSNRTGTLRKNLVLFDFYNPVFVFLSLDVQLAVSIS